MGLRSGLMLLLAITCSGCTPWAHRYQVASSGTVGCPADRIEISDHARGSGVESWRATCGGVAYTCSANDRGGAALCTAFASRSSSASTVAEARRPQLDVVREGDRVRRVAAVFRTYEGTVTLTFDPEVSVDQVALRFEPRSTASSRACDDFSMESSVGGGVHVPLVEGAASVPLRELLAAGQGYVRARICGRVWSLTSDDIDVLRRLGAHADESVHVPAQDDGVQIATAPPSDPSAVVRARLRERAPVIRACVDTRGLVTVEVSWDAQGAVSIRLRGSEDSATTGCASDAFGLSTVPTSQSGRLIQVLEAQ